MKNGLFFISTPLHKEYQLLSLIQDNSKITQRELSKTMNVSLAMINNYLDNCETRGLVIRKYSSVKNVEYLITKKGETQRKVLNLGYLKASLCIYNEAKNDCYKFFDELLKKKHRNVLLYGAGEVAELMISTINNDSKIDLNVLAVIDDDVFKQGKQLLGKTIISINEINVYPYDGILISSYANNKEIYDKMIESKIDSSKILQFFE